MTLNANKNPMVALNDAVPGLAFRLVEESGSNHNPKFTMEVKIGGQKFKGDGRSKKEARRNAAATALLNCVQFKNYWNPTLGSSFWEPLKKKMKVEEKSQWRCPSQVEKNPVMYLNEFDPNLEYVISEASQNSSKGFKAEVAFHDRVYEGFGSSKKQAKQACAKSILVKDSEAFGSMTDRSVPAMGIEQGIVSLDQDVSDRISKAISQRFEELVVSAPFHSRRKVLSGVVVSLDKAQKDLHVISVATGTKCINGEHISELGVALNDCHAEIICRRSARNFLLSQLESLTRQKAEKPNFQVFRPGGSMSFCVKDEVKFHLYINTAPCGDARIFSPHDCLSDVTDRHPHRKARGQLRTKIESGEGTIPVSTADSIQTWDGILQGARLLTMSCSDKIAKWNVVGFQGALLSQLVEPVYFDSITLGSLFNSQHLHRAIVGRLQNDLEGLPPPYKLGYPKLNVTTSLETRQTGRSPSFSINWTVNELKPEIVDAIRGKLQDSGQMSKLSKRAFFQRWLTLSKKLNMVQSPSNNQNYYCCKMNAKHYQLAKLQVFKAFAKANLGNWIKKPLEQDDFCL